MYLEKILQATGEGQAVTMQEILEELLKYGVAAERKSIYDDLDVLRSFGMDIRYRRGRPGGYYLAGQEKRQEMPGMHPQKPEEKNPVKKKGKASAEEQKKLPVFLGSGKDKKEIRLLCERSRQQEIRSLFGNQAQYKEKDPELLTVILKVKEGPEFYGWLTAMGKSVRIQKPKKSAQAYREYLKELAREYKGI